MYIISGTFLVNGLRKMLPQLPDRVVNVCGGRGQYLSALRNFRMSLMPSMTPSKAMSPVLKARMMEFPLLTAGARGATSLRADFPTAFFCC